MGTEIGNGCCIIIHPNIAGQTKNTKRENRSPKASLTECVGLARAIGLEVSSSRIFNIKLFRPATFIGSGAVEQIRILINTLNKQTGKKRSHIKKIDVVIINSSLSPIQQRNLEQKWELKVIDRTGLILEIFGARAKTKEGRLQVELAAKTYQRSRLVRSWTHLERQRGGAGFLGGPGETQIETDRRIIDQRITRIKREISQIARTRTLHRKSRRKVGYPIIALVGYTNAGKSTLFNYLTKANVPAKNQLFATLDPTMRCFNLPSGRPAILSDTVGFISNLPHELVDAFQATLEEVKEADIIFHIRDASHNDNLAQRDAVLNVLSELGIWEHHNKFIIEALNKTDLLNKLQYENLKKHTYQTNNRSYPISALNGQGIKKVLIAIEQYLTSELETISVKLRYEEGKLISWLYKNGEVIDRRNNRNDVELTVVLDRPSASRFRQIH